MNYKSYFVVLLLTVMIACNRHNLNQQNHETSVHGLQHDSDEHEHAHDDEFNIQYTAYSETFEVFAESEPLEVGKQAEILAHFTKLNNFKPLETGKVTATLTVNEQIITQVSEEPVRQGIYEFTITPGEAGTGSIIFKIEDDQGEFTVSIQNVEVYARHESAHEAAEPVPVAADVVAFSKEQSWKTDFATGFPDVLRFGQVIRSTALVEPSLGNEAVIVSRAGGIVNITSEQLAEGKTVEAGDVLLQVTGGSMAENDVSVRLLEARNNFEKAEADYERMKSLATENIVSQRELLDARQEYSNAKAVYDNLSKNFNQGGQSVTSPVNGFIRQIFVTNGAFVEAGTPLIAVAHSRRLMLTANLPHRYAHELESVASANIKDAVTDNIYSLDGLNGQIISGGKATGTDSHLIPLRMLIDNNGNFLPGSFVEVYLKILSDTATIAVPNTALLEEQGIFSVWIQVTPELFEKRRVVPGTTDGKLTEIKEGILPEERIVTRGAMLLKLAESTGTLDAHAGHVH